MSQMSVAAAAMDTDVDDDPSSSSVRFDRDENEGSIDQDHDQQDRDDDGVVTGKKNKRTLENMSAAAEQRGILSVESSIDDAMTMQATGETTTAEEETPPTNSLPLTFESSLPSDLRLRVASYLRPSDLYGKYARLSRLTRNDVRSADERGFLPQSHWIEVRCGSPGTDLRTFLHKMGGRGVRNALVPRGKRRRVKLIGHSNLRWPDEWGYMRDAGPYLHAASVPGVTSLDLSSSPPELWGNEREEPPENPRPFHFVTRAVVRMFPSLRELDLTGIHFPVPAAASLRYENEGVRRGVRLGDRAPLCVLEAMRWNDVRAGCRFLTDGYFFRWYPRLKELHLDDTIADCSMETYDVAGAYSDLMDASNYALPECVILSKCYRRLERVSLAGARYYHPPTMRLLPLPQAALVKFARAAPNLRWFRSDLAPGNVEVLRKELPGVMFEEGRRRRWAYEAEDIFVNGGETGRDDPHLSSAYVSW